MMWMSAGDFSKRDGLWDIAPVRWFGTIDVIQFAPTGSSSTITAKQSLSWKRNGRKSTTLLVMSHGRAAFTAMDTNIKHGAKEGFIMEYGAAHPFSPSINHQPER